MEVWASAARGRGAVAPLWIFKHVKNVVDRGLKVLFFGLFCHFSVFFSVGPLWKRLNSDFFGVFANFYPFFSLYTEESLKTEEP